MGFFGKKNCALCGVKIGLLGNRKLQDGDMCKACVKELSPFFRERRQSTVAEIKEQLDYRQANKDAVASFNITRTMGRGSKKLFLDEDKKQLIISSPHRWQETNPDVLSFTQITGSDVAVEETKNELYREDDDGKRESYDPPRYEYEYDFYVTVFVNTPWFSEIRFQVNHSRIEQRYSREYRDTELEMEKIREVLTQIREAGRTQKQPGQETTPVEKLDSVICPHCGAKTVPDRENCCEYCTGSLVS